MDRVVCFYDEYILPIWQKRAFVVFVKDGPNLITKLLPNRVKKSEVIKGHGEAGSIMRCILHSGGEEQYRVDACDSENCIFKVTLIKGDILREKVDTVLFEYRCLAMGPDKCILTVSTEYHLKEGVILNEEEIERNGRIVNDFYKAVVAILNGSSILVPAQDTCHGIHLPSFPPF